MAEWIELRPYLHAYIEEGRIVRLSIPAVDAETTTADDAGVVMERFGIVRAPGAEWQVTTEGDVTLSVLPVNAPELTGAIGGAKGGKAKTARKKAASANNGAKGGRPTLFQQMKAEVVKKWGSDKWMPGSSSFRHTEIMLEASSATVKRWEKEGLIELRGMMYVLTQKGYNIS